ncbi:MAG TPA: DUF5995 family protein [Opitutaceae bacterium]|nr:DUF5995 family protein [Opitutaceae bacterium]
MAPVQTIDEVIERLTSIVDQSRARGSGDGYFAALYKEVTAAVRDRINQGGFADGPRMERLDVIFANRYLEAWTRREAGQPAGAAWGVAFGAERAFWPVVLQHLLLGMNAHINFDLGLAAAATAPGAAIAGLKPDFDRINELLAGLVGDVENRLARIWPPLRWLEGFAGGADEAVVNFSMRCARDYAWSLATAMAAETDAVVRAARVREADTWAAVIGQRILHPGFQAGMILKWVRLRERGSVAAKLAVLSA